MADTNVTTEPTALPAPAEQISIDLDGVDLDAIERDLRDVETALDRLADGTYWSDEPVADSGGDDEPPVRPG